MHDLDLVVPSVLVDPSLSADLLRDPAMPNLGRVLARADASETFALPPRAALTPWQAWVFGRGASAGTAEVNVAELWAMACGIAPAPNGGRYVVEPAHFKVANDHLRLDDPRALDVTLVEARALASAIEPVLAEAGWTLDPIEPATLRHWFVTRDGDVTLSGAAIERAIGDNVAEWQPRAAGPKADRADPAAGDAAALAWRRCINEIQMLWFGHPVNEARELGGKPTINTLWLSGNGAPPAPLPHYAAVDSGLPLLAALAIEPDAPRALESFDRFIDPERRGDWSGWREQLAALDERIGAVLRQQSDKAIGAATFVFCGRDEARAVVLGARDGAKFWRGWGRKPSIAELLTEGPPA